MECEIALSWSIGADSAPELMLNLAGILGAATGLASWIARVRSRREMVGRVVPATARIEHDQLDRRAHN